MLNIRREFSLLILYLKFKKKIMVNVSEIPELIVNNIPLTLLAESYARVHKCDYFENKEENYKNILISFNNGLNGRFKKPIVEGTLNFILVKKIEAFLDNGHLTGTDLASLLNSCFVWEKVKFIDMPFIHTRLGSVSFSSTYFPFTKISKIPTLSYDY